MAYNEALAERIRQLMKRKRGITEKKMFGGICFLADSKMTVGVLKNELTVRVSAEKSAELCRQKNVRLMDFTGKPMRGILVVKPPAFKSDEELKAWIDLSVTYARSLPDKKPKKK